ncbi:MAG: DUF4386 family protein [Dermabacteraceae bacterium]
MAVISQDTTTSEAEPGERVVGAGLERAEELLARRQRMFLAGLALAAMAVLAPVGILGALSAGHTGAAAVTVLVIAALDVVAALALAPLLVTGGAMLGQIAVALRVVYAAIFAGAAGNLLGAADVAAFEATWDAALGLFGLHLVLAGIALFRAPHAPAWIGVLVVLAGIGYLADTVVVALGLGLGVELSAILFVGEVALLLWLIIGGRPRRRAVA